jgi:hypothetical protein
MEATYGNIIINETTCGCSSIHTVTAHHRNYPEIAVEASSAARAVEHLERLLERSLDYNGESWRREGLQQAVADVHNCARALLGMPAASPGLPEKTQGCQPVRRD